MSKPIVLIAICMISSVAFGAGVTLSDDPQTPIVINSDYTYTNYTGPVTVLAPWFNAQYKITTDQLITIVGIQEVVTAANGSTITYNLNFAAPLEVAAHSTYQTETQVLSSLPQQNSTIYSVEARLLGWTGSSSSSGPALNTVSTFATQ